MTSPAYHIPVMLTQCIEGLAIDPNGIYVDVTFGGGGHSREILKQLDKCAEDYTFPMLDNLLNIEIDFHLYPNDKSNVAYPFIGISLSGIV